MEAQLSAKLAMLRSTLRGMGSVLVAYSGGVDSTLLLKVAHDELGDAALGVTADTPSLPRRDLEEAQRIACAIGARHVCLQTDEMADAAYLANTPERCYFCKKCLGEALSVYAREKGYAAVVDGNNADDAGDYRPGRRAARELGIRSPLQEAGLGKAEVRALARELGLPNWDQPAAACLSSRIPYGTPIALDVLARIELAERWLLGLGLRQVRVRYHGAVARIETDPADFDTLLRQRPEVLKALHDAGFTYISLDLDGFRSGSMNEVLTAHA